jgi:hypothetical protein
MKEGKTLELEYRSFEKNDTLPGLKAGVSNRVA